MSPALYVEVIIRAAAIPHELHARLLCAVRRVNESGGELGVTWPDFKDHVPGEFGCLFRAFGTEDALGQFQTIIAPLEAASLISIRAARPVPPTDRSVVFVRGRKNDRYTPSAMRRRELRALARATEVVPANAAPAPTLTPKSPHYLTLWSSTTGKRFHIEVSREASERTGGRDYGLGRSLPDF